MYMMGYWTKSLCWNQCWADTKASGGEVEASLFFNPHALLGLIMFGILNTPKNVTYICHLKINSPLKFKFPFELLNIKQYTTVQKFEITLFDENQGRTVIL